MIRARNMYRLRFLLSVLPVAIVLLISVGVGAALAIQSWSQTKNLADDEIYAGKDRTLYCGAEYESHGDSDGSGNILNAPETRDRTIARSPRALDVAAMSVIFLLGRHVVQGVVRRLGT